MFFLRLCFEANSPGRSTILAAQTRRTTKIKIRPPALPSHNTPCVARAIACARYCTMALGLSSGLVNHLPFIAMSNGAMRPGHVINFESMPIFPLSLLPQTLKHQQHTHKLTAYCVTHCIAYCITYCIMYCILNYIMHCIMNSIM